MTEPGRGQTLSCLVLMPMYAGFEAIRAQIAGILDRAELKMIRLEEELEDSAWLLWLQEAVEASDVALADVTHHNPFVMYELGLVHQKGLPATLIMNTADDRLPATVNGSVCSLYGDGSTRFERNLRTQLDQACRQLDQAPTDASAHSHAGLYEQARSLAAEFERTVSSGSPIVNQAEFGARLTVALRRGCLNPAILSGLARTQVLLTMALGDSDRVSVIRCINDWSFGSTG